MSHDDCAAREFLTAKGWPVGLQNYIILKAVAETPFRYFICDDSGSMSERDGNKIVATGNEAKLVPCTRWNELTDSLRFHANLAELMKLPTEFRLLNFSKPVVVGGEGPSQLDTVLNLFDISPAGGTPLCRHIGEVVKRIQAIESHLINSGQKAVIIIATDGESSDGNVAKALAPLRQLPVNVIVRLCTDNSSIVEYWNNIDNELEFDIDVIDDFVGEAAEVTKFNGWLTYGEPLHRLREFGVPMKELDMIDERPLTGDQVKRLCSVLLDKPLASVSDPHEDLEAFISDSSAALSDIPATWSPVTKSQKPWIDVTRLRRHFSPKAATLLESNNVVLIVFIILILLLFVVNSYFKYHGKR